VADGDATRSRTPVRPRTELRDRPVRVVASLGMITAALLLPPLFSRVFAVGELLDDERRLLWVGALAMLAVSAAIAAAAGRTPRAVTGLLLASVALIGIELAARLVVNTVLGPAVRQELAWLADGTYHRNMLIKGHPFLHYTANVDANNLGFLSERDYRTSKPADTIRIACLGGSTTAGKFPTVLEQLLDDDAADGQRFEVLDFGQNGYGTAHLVVNFALNVIDHDPDYLVLHTAWNDTAIRGKPEGVASDYSNVFKAFEHPRIRDRWAIRTSVLYRAAQYRLRGMPAWANIRNALDVVGDTPITFDDADELAPYRSNIEKILDFASARDIEVILTTMPHATDAARDQGAEAKHIDQCNDVVREIQAGRRPPAPFVDLDRQMTGVHEELFVDLGHLAPEGHRIKAQALADVILDDLERDR